MDWHNMTIGPQRKEPPKVNIRYPCPGLFRFACMFCSTTVGLSVYYGGIHLFGLESLNWADPHWTVKHVVLIAVGLVLSIIAGLLGAGLALTIEVRNKSLNNLIIILWQFLINGSLTWILIIGVTMSLSIGKEQAKDAIIAFGAERATAYAVGCGSLLGLLMGIAMFIRIPMIMSIGFSLSISLAAAKWHFHIYDMSGKAWIAAGFIFPILLFFIAMPMVVRDYQQREMAIEQLR